MKRNSAILLVVALSFLAILPVALSFGFASAQSSGYTISSVDHQVQVLYTGHTVIYDTIHVSGQISDGFMIGLPYQYSADVLQAVAYDDTHTYQLNLGEKLGNRSGFYGAQVNFGGNTPSTFTVAFVLSNRLLTESSGSMMLDFPAYPSLTQNVGTCNVNLLFPSNPASISISKDDGQVSTASYTKADLPAYTYSVGLATFQEPLGSLQLSTISSLNRQVAIDSSGKVSVADIYHITNNSTTPINSFAFNVPTDASNVVVIDSAGRSLYTVLGASASVDTMFANATLVTYITQDQSTVMTVQYNLPSATLQNGNYVLGSSMLFPNVFYYVNQATVTFTPPEGASIISPPSSSLDSQTTLIRNAFQDTLIATRNGISPLDYKAPQQDTIQFSYVYNAVWASMRPTFWATLLATVGCVAIVVVRKRKPQEKTVAQTKAGVPILTSNPEEEEEAQEETEVTPLKPGETLTADKVHEFIDAYEYRKQLSAELKALDAKALKGKIPRRQYKVQKRATEIRLKSTLRNIERTKQMLRGSSTFYADIARQLDAAEEDLAETDGNITNLEGRYNRGELPLDYYKRTMGELQKRKEKAESNISGILLRLREKLR